MREEVPKESETIAVKRAVRIAEKLSGARSSLYSVRAWWSNKAVEILMIAFIFLLNFYLSYQFFGTSVTDAFFSGPVVPFLAKLVGVFGPPLNFSIQVINITFFLFFPISFYLFIRRIAERKFIAFFSALFVTLPFYPFANIRATALFSGIDSAHLASLTIFPVALTGIHSFLREGKSANFILAVIAASLVSLISPFGFTTFIIFSMILTFSEMLLGRGRLKVFRFASVFLFALGLSSFWYNPVFFSWMLTGPLGTEVRYTISRLIPISFFTVPPFGVFGYLLFDRKPQLQPLFLASSFTLVFALISLAGGGVFPSHPSRYIPELGISLAFLLSIVLVKIADYIKFIQIPGFVGYDKGVIVNAALVVIFLTLAFATVSGRDNLNAQTKVLGIWEGVDKGEIWRAKENFGLISSLLGFSLSGATAISLGVIWIRSRKKEMQKSE